MKIWIDTDACPPEFINTAIKISSELEISAAALDRESIPVPGSSIVPETGAAHTGDPACGGEPVTAGGDDIYITADTLVASRILERGGLVMDPCGDIYDAHQILRKLSLEGLINDIRDHHPGAHKITCDNDSSGRKLAETLRRIIGRNEKGLVHDYS